MNKLVIGTLEFEHYKMKSGTGLSTHALVGETLSADTVSFVLRSETDLSQILTEGTPAYYYSDGEIFGKYFVTKVYAQSAEEYKVECWSVVGQMTKSKHYGGIYNGSVASTVLSDIMGDIPFTIDPDISTATITGYLPIASRRDNLQQVLLAIGGTIKVLADGSVHIAPMDATNTGTFGTDRCFYGGRVENVEPTVGLKLTEHNYFESGETVTLFDDGIDGTETIEFSEPYHSLSITGGTITSSGANFAVISGYGAVVLTGKKYTHVTRVITVGSVQDSSTANVRTVDKAYLANPQIANTLATRIFNSLSYTKKIIQDVVVGSERAGDVVSVINPYTKQLESALIQNLNIRMSAKNRASGEFLVGFSPEGVLSGFKSYVMLTGSGTWTVPDGVYKIRIIVVGAGTGGGGGKRGTAGTDSSEKTPGDGGSGGAAGKSGSGGRIFEISLDVVPGQVFSFVCGTGGVGGKGQTATQAVTEGTNGTATTFGGYSSDYGRLYPYGYYEAKTGLTLAASGEDGFAGGKGGRGNDTDYDNDGNYVYAENGEAVNGFSGGKGGRYRENKVSERNIYEYYGGAGGGAANGAKGGDSPSYGGTKSSKGGNGATGTAGKTGTNPGQGGGAGNGGGGGGGGGVAYHWNPTSSSSWMTGVGGSPGDGTDGGTGAAGAVIVYY